MDNGQWTMGDGCFLRTRLFIFHFTVRTLPGYLHHYEYEIVYSSCVHHDERTNCKQSRTRSGAGIRCSAAYRSSSSTSGTGTKTWSQRGAKFAVVACGHF
eukprot:scaffold409922_cov28-Prasinocladus_malaysianus.AAC.1